MSFLVCFSLKNHTNPGLGAYNVNYFINNYNLHGVWKVYKYS